MRTYFSVPAVNVFCPPEDKGKGSGIFRSCPPEDKGPFSRGQGTVLPKTRDRSPEDPNEASGRQASNLTQT